MIDTDKAVAALRSALHSKCELERVIQGMELGEYDAVIEPPAGDVEGTEDDASPAPTPTGRRRKS